MKVSIKNLGEFMKAFQGNAGEDEHVSGATAYKRFKESLINDFKKANISFTYYAVYNGGKEIVLYLNYFNLEEGKISFTFMTN